MHRTVATLSAVLVLVALSGCTADPAPEPTRSPPASSSPAATQEEAAGPVTMESTFLGTPVEVAVDPVQVQDDVALLTVHYRLGAGADDDASFSPGTELRGAKGPMGPHVIRLVDLEAATVHVPGVDEKLQPAVTREPLTVRTGEETTSEGFYSAPAGDSVAVLIPYLGLVRDVPVVRLGAGEELPTSPQEQGRAGTLTYASAPVDAFTVAFDDTSAARVAADEVTVALASDVLFAVDESALTADAQAIVDSAAAAIVAKGAGGEVRVVGHTDDAGTDAYNEDLSVRRAQSVVDRLAPGGAYTVTAEGRGEQEPAVPGSSPEARAANRRVEIRFTTQLPGASVEVGGGAAAVPEPTGPLAEGSAQVTPAGVEGFGVRALSVERVGAYVVGSLGIERTGTGADRPEGCSGTSCRGSPPLAA